MFHWSEKIEIANEVKDAMLLPEGTLMYDIETTGLSSKYHQIYLIGCCYREGASILLHQFFAENYEEEKELLLEFLKLSSTFSQTMTFNGQRFDEPFIRTRCDIYEISSEELSFNHIDLYKECKKLKKLLHLPNLKQKSIEQFLGIARDDEYSGGELIAVYKAYVESPTDEKLHLLKLHNYEDVKNMVALLSIRTYLTLGDCTIDITSVNTKEYLDYQGKIAYELEIIGELPSAIPRKVRIQNDDCYMIIDGTKVSCLIRLFSNELLYFLPNPKEYVYLPNEDMVILKSLATQIPKERKKSATAKTCYIKKTGCFLPIPGTLKLTEDIHRFRISYDDKKVYLLLDDIRDDTTFFSHYCNNIITDSYC